jgi:hypothetical protein
MPTISFSPLQLWNYDIRKIIEGLCAGLTKNPKSEY